MCRPEIVKYEKIKEGKEVKHTNKRIKFVEGTDKDSPPQI